MAKYSASFTADASTYICDIHRRRDANDWFGNVLVSGTFGSGTVAIQVSPDGGTTKITLNQDGTATAASGTAAAVYNIKLGNPSKNTETYKLYATLTGSTNPAISVVVFDNQ